jgi:ligand-binding SRPBCC domain-containing protein
MKVFVLEKETLIQAGPAIVWDFFSSPHNLAQITPPYMRFRIKNCPSAKEIYNGMLIRYRVSPLAGIPLGWVTEIKDIKKGSRFTDVQQHGPFALWEHTHIFEAAGNDVLMTDRVRYALPLGLLGVWARKLFVKRQLEEIFEYRDARIREIFS